MTPSPEFLRRVLDTISDHIVVIDGRGDIVFVNHNWTKFGENNDCRVGEDWAGVNYLAECDKAAAMGDDFGTQAASGIRQVIDGTKDGFYLEYPCHSPATRRWFMMQVKPFTLKGTSHFVLSHQDITERKLAEEKALSLSRRDGLTDTANRQYFDEFLDDEWKRCARLGLSLSLAILDLDYFKLLNDTYGHQAGDDALKRVATVLKNSCRRAMDMAARYGGEEFALVYGNTGLAEARNLVEQVLEEIRELAIANEESPTGKILTASAGLVSTCPDKSGSTESLIEAADNLLYSAKESGRDQLACSDRHDTSK